LQFKINKYTNNNNDNNTFSNILGIPNIILCITFRILSHTRISHYNSENFHLTAEISSPRAMPGSARKYEALGYKPKVSASIPVEVTGFLIMKNFQPHCGLLAGSACYMYVHHKYA
jgi:hypothetical protein